MPPLTDDHPVVQAIAARLSGVCLLDERDVAIAIVARLGAQGYRIVDVEVWEWLVESARHDEGCSAEFGDTYRCRCGFRSIADKLTEARS